MFIEVTAGYLWDDDDTPYEEMGIDVPEDYEPDWIPTLLHVGRIVRVNSCDEGKYTMIALSSPADGVKVKETYNEVSKRIADVTSQICQCNKNGYRMQVDPNASYWGDIE